MCQFALKSIDCVTLVSLSLKSSVDVSVTGRGGGQRGDRPCGDCGRSLRAQQRRRRQLRLSACGHGDVSPQVQPSAWLLLGLDSDKQKLTINYCCREVNFFQRC